MNRSSPATNPDLRERVMSAAVELVGDHEPCAVALAHAHAGARIAAAYYGDAAAAAFLRQLADSLEGRCEARH